MKIYIYNFIILNFTILLLFGATACGKKSMPVPEDQSENNISKWILKVLNTNQTMNFSASISP